MTALSYRALGSTEFATRLPDVLFSGMSVAVVYALARALYGDRVTAALAGLIMALSPYDLAFAATAFTDVQATFWVLVAAWCAVARPLDGCRDRGGAGLCRQVERADHAAADRGVGDRA